MNKSQIVHSFWNSFNIPAYDENTVSPVTTLPHITYFFASDNFDHPVEMNASLWYRSTSWQDISNKADEIALVIGDGLILPVDGGYIWITRGRPFAQRMADSDDSIRRIYINIQVEFLTQI